MKKRFKILIMLAIVVTLSLSLFIVASAIDMPNYNGSYTYYVVYKTTSADPEKEAQNCIYSAEPCTLNGTTIGSAGGTTWYGRYAGETWALMGNLHYGSGYIEVIDANYPIGGFVPAGGHFISPADNAVVSENPHVEFEYNGYTSDQIKIIVSYTADNGQTTDFIIPDGTIDFSQEGVGFIPATYSVPYGKGVNTFKLYGYTPVPQLLDTISVTFTNTQPASVSLLGLEKGGSYSLPPALTVHKVNYPDAVGVYVNGEKYIEVKNATTDKMLFDFYTDNLKIGNNTITLNNMRTNAVIDTFNFVITSGYVDDNGNYWNDQWGDNHDRGAGATGSGSLGDLGEPPVPPGEGATIIDWVKYIGEMIAYVFNLAISVIKDFAKNIGDMLTSLFGIISPVLVFLQLMFGSLPAPLATGLYALFTLGCVLMIWKMLRR